MQEHLAFQQTVLPVREGTLRYSTVNKDGTVTSASGNYIEQTLGETYSTTNSKSGKRDITFLPHNYVIMRRAPAQVRLNSGINACFYTQESVMKYKN